jgi:hypothetical protein
MLPAREPRPVLRRLAIYMYNHMYFAILKGKYVAFIKREKERTYRDRRAESKRIKPDSFESHVEYLQHLKLETILRTLLQKRT